MKKEVTMIDRKRFVEEGLWLVGSVATVLVFMIVIMRLVEGPAPTLSELATVFVVVYGIVIFVRLAGWAVRTMIAKL